VIVQEQSILSELNRQKVLITGISGSLGKLLANRLCDQFAVLGTDTRKFVRKPQAIKHLEVDLRKNSALVQLKRAKPDHIIHLGVIRNPHKHQVNSSAYYYNVEVTAQLLRLAEELNIKKFIFLSTANLYGPSATSSGFLSEDAPLHGADRSPEVRDLVALDMMIQSFFWKHPHTETVILRPVHIVGKHLNNAPSTYLRLRTAPTLLGYDPLLQLVHESDVINALELALKNSVRGIFNIVGKSQAPLSRMLQRRKISPLPTPQFLLRPLMRNLFKYKFSSYPPGEMDHLKYTCLVDGSRAKKHLGFSASLSLGATLDSLG